MSSKKRILASMGRGGVLATLRAKSTGLSVDDLLESGGLYEFKEGTVDDYVSNMLKAAHTPPRPFRHGNYIHVSDVISKCVRKIAINRRLNVLNPTDRIADGQALTFVQGDAIHDYVKNRFIRSYPDKVWSQWRCLCGGLVTEPMVFSRIPKSLMCKKCLQPPTIHAEYVIVDEEHEVTGAVDLIFLLEEFPAYYVTELKSMAKEMWEALARPLPDHVVQTMFYWKLMERQGHAMVDQFSILYVKKEYSFKWPYKEFVVKATEAEKILEPFIADLEALAVARDPESPLPPRIVCANENAPEAKKCNVCVTCFQLP